MLRDHKPEEEDIFLLKGEDSVVGVQTKIEKEYSKGLSSQLVELDFYISEGYFDNAEKVLERLKREYPESKEIIARLERVRKLKDQQPRKRETVKVSEMKSSSKPSEFLPSFEDSPLAEEPFATGLEPANPRRQRGLSTGNRDGQDRAGNGGFDVRRG